MNKASVVNANPDSSPGDHNRPWYKQIWVWFIIAVPASSVVTGIILVTIAANNADDLVMDDWYREGRGTNRSMAAENMAEDLGIGVRATAIDGGTLFQFHAAQTQQQWPAELTLTLRHPTLANEDREYVLQHQGDGRYLADVTLPHGRWHVRLASDDVAWRLAGPVAISSSGELAMGAEP